MKRFALLLMVCTLVCNVASAATEQEVVDDAARILRNFRSMPEKDIPASVLRHAKGLAVITVLKVGFGISGKGGQGVVVARNGGEWSAHLSSELVVPVSDFRSALR